MVSRGAVASKGPIGVDTTSSLWAHYVMVQHSHQTLINVYHQVGVITYSSNIVLQLTFTAPSIICDLIAFFTDTQEGSISVFTGMPTGLKQGTFILI